MRTLLKKVNATHVIYLLLHLVLIMAGIIWVMQGGTVGIAIGTSIVATGSAGVVLFVYVLLTDTAARRIELISDFGFVEAFTTRSAAIKDRYDERLQKARSSIDIMGFGLSLLRHDYINQFEDWSRRARVRILLVDPDAPAREYSYADQRDLEEQNPVGEIRKDVEAFLEATESLRITRAGRFDIRLYSCLPSVNIFKVDDEMFWGPYLLKRQSRNTSTFIVRRGGHLFRQLEEHFDDLWTGPFSRPIPTKANPPPLTEG